MAEDNVIQDLDAEGFTRSSKFLQGKATPLHYGPTLAILWLAALLTLP